MTTEARVVITNPTGLHARPAVKFSQLAAGFDADVQVRLDGSDQWVPARSTARVMKLKATPESVIFVRADGEQADEAVAALVAFIHRDFDEGPGATAHAEPPPAAGPDDRDDEPLPSLPRGRTLSATVAAHELAALEAAVRAAVAQLEALAAGEGTLANDLILFQVSLLQDQAFLDPVLERVRAGQPADRAWAEHLEGEIADYSTAETAYLRDRAADLRDLGDRVAMCLGGGGRTDEFPDGAIVVAEELTPSRFLQIDWSPAAPRRATRRCSRGPAAYRCSSTCPASLAISPAAVRPSSTPSAAASCWRRRRSCSSSTRSASVSGARASARPCCSRRARPVPATASP